ncbi:MAGUK p55 subfamily member 3-like [Takifugu rubripes]|uniref:MAGUK p55 subfamily member 3-like n=1 Tax=Takifugu rubripes TaxID=31033 RepID=UPI0011458A8D|nr:MAGUK p55 subfamily member 3-like [Takifugu rubripes]
MPIVSASTGLHETLALLTSQLHPDTNHKEDLVFLKDVFSEKSLSYIMKIHDKLKEFEKHSPTPVLHSASCLAEDLAEELQNKPLEEDERELLHLLSTPHIKAVLSAHDTVAQKNFDPVLPPLPEDVDNDLKEESVKIVRLVKNKEPLGATIRRDEATGAVIVARIMRGGAADRSGLVHVGDELREVNGNLVTHKRPDEISQILVYLRALFDYTPYEDKATPCQEAGLPFKRRDILQVVSQDDATWWQAKRVGDCSLRAALIPSTQFQERRLRYRMKMGSIPAMISSKAPTSSLRRNLRLKKDRQEPKTPDANQADFRIYEEVTQYLPRPGDRPRLIVLIDTTRARKCHEREGIEYHFITRAAFESDIHNGKFIEYGEYKDNLYGTSLESIHKVLSQNKVCLMDVQPEVLKTLRTAEFKPFIIFVKPHVTESQKKHGSSSSLGFMITEEDLQEMKSSAERMDECYGHWVDYILVKEDPASALAELQLVLDRVQLEPQWVPASWLRL